MGGFWPPNTQDTPRGGGVYHARRWIPARNVVQPPMVGQQPMGFGSRVFRDNIRHPSRIYPGSSGNRSGSHRNQLFSISGDPGCPDDEKVKKLSGTTFFCSGALFLSRSTFLSLEHFFSKSAHISDIPNWMSIQLWMTFIRYDTTTCRYRLLALFGYAHESAAGEAQPPNCDFPLHLVYREGPLYILPP